MITDPSSSSFQVGDLVFSASLPRSIGIIVNIGDDIYVGGISVKWIINYEGYWDNMWKKYFIELVSTEVLYLQKVRHGAS